MTSIHKATYGELTEFMKRLAQAGFTAEMIREVNGNSAMARHMARSLHNLVTVPEGETSTKLLRRAKEQVDHFESALEGWNFFMNEAGKTYEILTWKPCRPVSAKEVCQHFFNCRAFGNAVVFTTWVIDSMPYGDYVTIPPSDPDLFHYPGGDLCALAFSKSEMRKFVTRSVSVGFREFWTFVAFREVESGKPSE